ncbi:MAG: polysaccharide lyase [Gammaproteobacteria bacterium]|nr:polysaccharide lyase [Gammaproteobacteria bacterium]MDH3535372.1 polysaccharide lyase [Gammaproteobacteria bacterium]
MKLIIQVCVFLIAPLVVGAGLAAEFTGLKNGDLMNPGNLLQGNVKNWSKKRIGTSHGLTFEDDVKGVYAARFEIRPTDEKISDGYRAELRDPYVASPNEEVWYRFRTLIPRQLLEDQDLSIVLAQWHDKKANGAPAARPPLALRMKGGVLRADLWNDEIFAAQGDNGDGKILYESGDFPADEWIEFVFGVKWSPDDSGLVRMWMNGKLVAEHRGAIGYYDDIYGPYFKLGIYTVHDFKQPAFVYHSDYRRAANQASLDKE